MVNCFGAHLTHGPPLSTGFFYDCYMGDQKIDPESYKEIEDKAAAATKADHPFQRLILSKEEALELFSNNPFKVQLIKNKIPDNAATTAYRCGNLIDLCTGPHLPSTGKIKAFKIIKNSSSYWLGNNQNDSLQRVYGISFPEKKLLDTHLKMLEEQAKRDHRNLGLQQKQFYFNKLSPGCALWTGNGTKIYNKLQNMMIEQYKYRGFTNVITPNMYKKALWKTSGHYFKYRKDMYFVKDGEDTFGLKPMNCPGHALLFREEQKSYKDLPLRFAEFGVLHRNEISGALNGLTRVRRFCQDDAHIFIRDDQTMCEVSKELDFTMYIHNLFGLETVFYLSTRPDNYAGEISTWEMAEKSLEEALKNKGLKYGLDIGGGAFYGPKIDIKIKDCYNREHQIATIQLDFVLPERFNLQYQDKTNQTQDDDLPEETKKEEKTKKGKKDKKQKGKNDAKPEVKEENQVKEKKLEDWEIKSLAIKKDDYEKKAAKDAKDALAIANYVKDDEKEEEKFDYEVSGHLKPGFKRPVMVHRAILGSIERFTAILSEHLGGKWPFWLNPKQVLVVPISQKFGDYAEKVKNRLCVEGFDADVDLSTLTQNKKVRNAQLNQYSYILCCGEKEVNNDSMTVRLRDAEKDLGTMTVLEIIKMFQDLSPKQSDSQKDTIANCYWATNERKINETDSSSNLQQKKWNDELTYNTFLKGDGLEFSNVDENAFNQVKSMTIDKLIYPNLYRWSLMCAKLSSTQTNSTLPNSNDTNSFKKISPIQKSSTYNPPSSDNPCNLSHEELMKFEEILKTHSYLSCCDEPNQSEDAYVLAEFEKTKYQPDQQKYPKLSGWWWHLCCITANARSMWKQNANAKS